ncbi:MAG: hypothetical protein LH628_01445 [Microcoleus sp. CAN_BIN18]|nr:hypothetical protein [Microcoleus sp. CAN_BIN18]
MAFEKLYQFKTQIAKLIDRPLNKIKTNKYNIVQITIALPDNLSLTEADVRIELPIALYQHHSHRD